MATPEYFHRSQLMVVLSRDQTRDAAKAVTALPHRAAEAQRMGAFEAVAGAGAVTVSADRAQMAITLLALATRRTASMTRLPPTTSSGLSIALDLGDRINKMRTPLQSSALWSNFLMDLRES